MKVATSMRVLEVEIDCPYCGATQSGFLGNPQGNEFECDECEETYKVHSEADPEVY